VKQTGNGAVATEARPTSTDRRSAVNERLAIVGSGAIASGLASVAASHGHAVHVLARSDDSAQRARSQTNRHLTRMGLEDLLDQIEVVTEADAIIDATYVVEAVIENEDAKKLLLRTLGDALGPEAVIATTTSSLSIERLAEASGRPDRFAGLHVFNPVPKMELVELAFPAAASERTRERTRALAAQLEKTSVDVPDIPGFVVNRLLFPYLFSAVRLLEETGMDPVDVDTCMRLGAGHPMGPLALLDLVGLDVAVAIGGQIGAEIPARVHELIAEGALGRKTSRGFLTYEPK
jgi:3-hydroxybutyryl-CoA dehydrogenase